MTAQTTITLNPELINRQIFGIRKVNGEFFAEVRADFNRHTLKVSLAPVAITIEDAKRIIAIADQVIGFDYAIETAEGAVVAFKSGLAYITEVTC